MATSTADSKRRVVLPTARPGDVFDIRSQGEGRLLLVRLEQPGPGMNMERCLEAGVRDSENADGSPHAY